MIKLSKMTFYVVIYLCTLFRKTEELMLAPDLSKNTALTLISVQKLLKLLFSKSAFLKTIFGTIRSYILNRNSSDISGENFTKALDGHITLISYIDKSESSCEAKDICFFGGKGCKIKERKSLNNISLKNFSNYEISSLIYNNKEIMIDTISYRKLDGCYP